MIGLAPDIAQFRDKAAEAYTMAKRYEKAFTHAQKAVELAPTNYSYRVHAAELALSREKNAAALTILEPVVAEQPGFDRASFFTGIALHRLGGDLDAPPRPSSTSRELLRMLPLRRESREALGLGDNQIQELADAAVGPGGMPSFARPLDVIVTTPLTRHLQVGGRVYVCGASALYINRPTNQTPHHQPTP